MGGVGGGQPALDLAAPRPRRCAGRATSAGRSSRPRRRSASPGSRSGTPAPRSTTSASLPLSETTCVDPGVEVVAVGEDQLGARRAPRRRWAAARTRAGRCSAAGSGRPRPRSPPTSRTQSPIWVVVATTSSLPGSRARAAPQPAASGAGRRAAAPRRERRAARATQRPRRRATRAKTRAGDAGDRRPRRGVGLDREPEADACPRAATRATLASCQLAIRSVEEPGGRRRDDEERGDEQGADHRERRGASPARSGRAARASRTRAPRAPARAGAPGRSRAPASAGRAASVASSVAAAAPAASAMSPPSISSRLPKSSVSTLAPEPKTSLARITPAARQPTRTIATTAVVVLASRRPSAELPALKASAAPKAPSGAREAEAVGEDQAREGGGADRVREEGEAAQDDPGAEQAGRDREDQDLEQAALDEGELEGLEQGRLSLVRMSLVCSSRGRLRSAAACPRPREEKWLPLLLRRSRRWSAARIRVSKSSPSSGKTAQPTEALGRGRAAGSRVATALRSLRPCVGALAVGAGGDHGELVAADPGEGVGGAQDRARRARPSAQDRVADRVAVLVVDRLEVVEVEDQQRQRARRRASRRPRVVRRRRARGAGRRRRRGGWRRRSAGRGWRSRAGAPRRRPVGA